MAWCAATKTAGHKNRIIRMTEFTEDQQALYDLMSDLSEEYFFAGWMCGTEDWLWRQLNEVASDNYSITDSEKQELEAAKNKVGSWVVWNDDIDDPEFLTMEQWKERLLK